MKQGFIFVSAADLDVQFWVCCKGVKGVEFLNLICFITDGESFSFILSLVFEIHSFWRTGPGQCHAYQDLSPND